MTVEMLALLLLPPYNSWMKIRRRRFLATSTLAAAGAGIALSRPPLLAAVQVATVLPEGSAPLPVKLPYFPDRLHAFIWRNWELVPVSKMAEVLGASEDDVLGVSRSMGLKVQPIIRRSQIARSYITVIRRNWHLLPYEQLLQLLGWTAEHMAFMLREDDFLFVKLGNLKPKCDPLKFSPPSDAARQRAAEIAAVIRRELPDGIHQPSDPLFEFIKALSTESKDRMMPRPSQEAPRFCYSYFALYGDPLLDAEADPFPDGYLQRLARLGVNGVWLQAVLQKLAPNPWVKEPAEQLEQRLRNLSALVERAGRQGIGIYLYLNEPRSMPLAFYQQRPEKKGVVEGDYAALCTSDPEVQKHLVDSVSHICQAVPGIAGFFTISGSENLTNCWSHGAGAQCPRCGKRSPGEVIAEVNTLFFRGIHQAKSNAKLIAWDWGWHDAWAEEIINKLPQEVWLQSVSEWSIPINRGGIQTTVGEYSISTVGPGPRATRHWELARKRGLKTSAKIQAGNTWELSAVPSIPAVYNVAKHVTNLQDAEVDGLMLGWTLGGYPSPNLEVACRIASTQEGDKTPAAILEATLKSVATGRFGPSVGEHVVEACHAFSTAFSEFPYHGGVVYNAPMQYGPSNLLWAEPTGYSATMVGFPYDDLTGWRQVYPPEVFINQFTKIADGFDAAIEKLTKTTLSEGAFVWKPAELKQEIDVATAASIHFRSTANQAKFVWLRQSLQKTTDAAERKSQIDELEQILRSEMKLARELHAIQQRDSRIGFEATNHYFYVPQDLLEKILNCSDLLENWIPSLKRA